MFTGKFILEGLTTDGATTHNLDVSYERGYVLLEFFSDAGRTTRVTPSAGTVVFHASETGSVFGTVPSGTVNVANESYDRPHWAGPVDKLRITRSGIVGAGYYRVTVFTYGS